jgi:hypothetical protein
VLDVVCKWRAYSAILGLGNEEVDDSSLEEVPDDEDDISLPCDHLQRDGPSKLVDETSCMNIST